MTCNQCGESPRLAKKHSYLVIMVDSVTHREGHCIMQSECAHGMQEKVNWYASKAQLTVIDPSNREAFLMMNPVIAHIDAKIAAHIPIADPV